LVLGYLIVFEKKIKVQWLLSYGLLALAVFFILDVYLWRDPLARLSDSLAFHVQYSQGQHVDEIGYPWFQPFIWILTSPPGGWHPNVFFYYGFDGLITLFALGGLKREWAERRWLVVWLASGMIFLLLWPTKWPQYALTVTPALCIMGAESLRRFIRWARAQESYWDYLKGMFPKPDKWLWYAIGAFGFFIAAIYLSAAIKLAVGRVGWSNVTRANSFLPSNTIYDLLPLDDGQILIATEKGAVLWIPAETTEGEPTWLVYNPENSGLANQSVIALARDRRGDAWFGTTDGISRFDGESWLSFGSEDLGISSDYIVSLTSSPDGRIYAGTLEGAVTWNGVIWTPVEQTRDQAIFSIATNADGSSIWFGMKNGAGRLEVRDDTWTFFPTDAPVKHILIDAQNTLWAATSGAGLARLDGAEWTYFRTSNSGIPYNTANWVTEVQPGVIWVGTAMPTSTGGAVASFDGINWYSYLTNNSGASGAEVTVIAIQSEQVWIGTRTAGIDLFNLGR
jgi:sugar lactone lactonase YvrE